MAQIGEVGTENGGGDDSGRCHYVYVCMGSGVKGLERSLEGWRGYKEKKNVDLKLWAVYISGEEWICPVHRKSRNILKYPKIYCCVISLFFCCHLIYLIFYPSNL
jgi:hypothetical protein